MFRAQNFFFSELLVREIKKWNILLQRTSFPPSYFQAQTIILGMRSWQFLCSASWPTLQGWNDLLSTARVVSTLLSELVTESGSFSLKLFLGWKKKKEEEKKQKNLKCSIKKMLSKRMCESAPKFAWYLQMTLALKIEAITGGLGGLMPQTIQIIRTLR